MPRFRLRSDDPVDLYFPSGHGDSLPVEPAQVVEAPGVLVTSRPPAKDGEPAPEPLPTDAYIVATGDEEIAWPKALWELVEDKPAAPAAPAREGEVS
jgi:hypothetical protein